MSAATGNSPPRRRVLWVDDDDDIRAMLAEHTRLLGVETVYAADGREGLRLWQEARQAGEPFAAVVLDIAMDGLTGHDVAAVIRGAGDRVPLVFCTAYSLNGYGAVNRQRAQDFDAIGFWTKPIQFERLGEMLGALLAE